MKPQYRRMYVSLTTKLLLQDNIYHDTASLWIKKKNMLKNVDYPIINDLEGAIVDESISSNKLHSSQTYSKIHTVAGN